MSRQYENIPAETLIVSNWYSKCNNCGTQTLPYSETHEEVSGYGPRRPGCGIKWEYVVSEYGPRSEQIVRDMRPDLEYIDLYEKLGMNNQLEINNG